MLSNQLSFTSQFIQQNVPKSTHRIMVLSTQTRDRETRLNPGFQSNESFPWQPIQIRPNPNHQQTNFPINTQIFGKSQNVSKPTNNISQNLHPCTDLVYNLGNL